MGLRQYGFGKDHQRPNPIVEMGLMMDKRGHSHLHEYSPRQYQRTGYGSPA